MIALVHKYRGVRNEYLEDRLRTLRLDDCKIEGAPKAMFPCPCCNYLTLDSKGRYEICPVCFWEDDGSADLDRYSGPNHMTLGEAKANLAKFGAVSPAAKKFVDPDGAKKWLKS
jgi:hypothetical protein